MGNLYCLAYLRETIYLALAVTVGGEKIVPSGAKTDAQLAGARQSGVTMPDGRKKGWFDNLHRFAQGAAK